MRPCVSVPLDLLVHDGIKISQGLRISGRCRTGEEGQFLPGCVIGLPLAETLLQVNHLQPQKSSAANQISDFLLARDIWGMFLLKLFLV